MLSLLQWFGHVQQKLVNALWFFILSIIIFLKKISKILLKKGKGLTQAVNCPISKNTYLKERLKKQKTSNDAPLGTHPILMLFDQKSRIFNSIKGPLVSFIPQILHDTKRQGLPHLIYFVAMKMSLTTFQQINHGSRITPKKKKKKNKQCKTNDHISGECISLKDRF